MTSTTQHGYLVLADISGYTSFVAGTELEHGQAIMTELLELIIERFNTCLTISKLEGDAVFAYTPETSIERGETCECRACRAIPTLDLKFLLHHGDYFIQNIAGTKELIGSDVNLVHRLLKNRVAEKTGWRGYALFSGQSLEHLAIRPKELFEQPESYEHLGEVKTYSLNLHTRYEEIVAARHVVIEPRDAHRILEYDYAAPQNVIWSWFNEPAKRGQWMHSQIVPIFPAAGRNGMGARNHCVHGKDQVVVEDILDHRPIEYFTVSHTPRGMSSSLLLTFAFSPRPTGGTHLRITSRMKANMPDWAAKIFCMLVMRFQILKMWDLNGIDGLIQATGKSG
jgi:uncharacterized protein YndB with AHSA1/START domain